MTAGSEDVFRALDVIKRRDVAEILNHFSLLGWRLSHPETGAVMDPAVLARHILEHRSSPLVPSGEGGTVEPSPTSTSPEGGTPDGNYDDPDEALS
jgi:hypothetical protein